MERESLIKVQEEIADMLNNVDIPIHDKVELLINLLHFLDYEKYDKNIKVLQKKKRNDII